MRIGLPIIHPEILFLIMLPVSIVLPFAGQCAARCPWCGGKLGFLLSSRFNPARLPCCFHCGKSLNDMVAADGKPKNVWLKKPASWQDELA